MHTPLRSAKVQASPPQIMGEIRMLEKRDFYIKGAWVAPQVG